MLPREVLTFPKGCRY